MRHPAALVGAVAIVVTFLTIGLAFAWQGTPGVVAAHGSPRPIAYPISPPPASTPRPGPPPLPSPIYTEQWVNLTGFDPLSPYVFGSNCVPTHGDCFGGGGNYSQVPVLSSDSGQPLGIYYVNNGSDLVEYDLANATYRTMAHVTLLYQTFGGYAGMTPNEFMVEYGTDEALFYGMLTPYTSSSYYLGALTFETVNLTTGAVRMMNSTLATGHVSATNQQAMLIGNDLVLLITEGTNSDPLEVFDLANNTSWSAGSLPFFEANNIYWLPQLHQLINVEADGDVYDRVQQLDEVNGSGAVTFRSVSEFSVDSGFVVNWVDGLAYNSSAHQIAFSDGAQSGRTYVLTYNSTNVLTPQGEVRYSGGVARLMGQRYVYTGEWVMGGFVNGIQYVFDPWTGQNATVSVPFTDLSSPMDVCDGSCFLGQYAPTLRYVIDFHSSVARNDPFWSVLVATAE